MHSILSEKVKPRTFCQDIAYFTEATALIKFSFLDMPQQQNGT